jgi:hypothetical protein
VGIGLGFSCGIWEVTFPAAPDLEASLACGFGAGTGTGAGFGFATGTGAAFAGAAGAAGRTAGVEAEEGGIVAEGGCRTPADATCFDSPVCNIGLRLHNNLRNKQLLTLGICSGLKNPLCMLLFFDCGTI